MGTRAVTRRGGSRRRRIAVVTGTRAEYGLLTSVMDAINARKNLQLQLVVAGMHLLRKFGYTVRQIEGDGRRIDARVPMQRGDDSVTDQAEGLSRGIAGIARFLEDAQTDIVVVLGDRIEALAGALAGVTTHRIVAHIHGGDVAPGDFDDTLRHAITKLAHVHFPATRHAARRIIRMGEQPAQVHTVGAVGLDRLGALVREATPTQHQGAALVVHHAHGRSARVEGRVMRTILDAVAARGLTREIVYPNSDGGHTGVIDAIERHRARHGGADVRVHRSLPRDAYLRRLLAAEVLIGNSSSGIIEAPFAGTPSVDVGDRQAGREPGGRSVLRVGESEHEIQAGLDAAERKRPRPGGATIYGDGGAGERIAATLARTRIDATLLRKTIRY